MLGMPVELLQVVQGMIAGYFRCGEAASCLVEEGQHIVVAFASVSVCEMVVGRQIDFDRELGLFV